MKNPSFVALQSLESRTLFSAGVHGHPHPHVHHTSADPATITADQQKLATDKQQFLTDRAAWVVVLKADLATIKMDKSAGLAPLCDTLKADEKKMHDALAADMAAVTAAYNSDIGAIQTDRANINADIAAGNTAQLSFDQAQYAADHAKAEADVHPLYLTYQADVTAYHTMLFNDRAAIQAQRFANESAMQADYLKLNADAKQWMATLNTDRAAIKADGGQLKDDGGDNSGGDTNTNTVGKHH